MDGTGGVVSEPLPGLLLIRQREKVQEEVVAFFDELRERTKDRKAKGLPPQFPPEAPKPDDVVTEFYQLHSSAEADEIKQAVYDVVEPKTWEDHCGEGTIAIINNLLVIKNSVNVHRDVHRFLVRVSAMLDKQSRNDPFGGGFFGRSRRVD